MLKGKYFVYDLNKCPLMCRICECILKQRDSCIMQIYGIRFGFVCSLSSAFYVLRIETYTNTIECQCEYQNKRLYLRKMGNNNK